MLLWQGLVWHHFALQSILQTNHPEDVKCLYIYFKLLIRKAVALDHLNHCFVNDSKVEKNCSI